MNDDAGGLDPQGQARQALGTAVRDYGPRVLSNPALLGNLFKDLLPDSPREASLLVAAADSGTASMLSQQVAGVGPDAAVRNIAGNLAQSRALDPQASLWAVGEIARAMGYPVSEANRAAPPADATLPWTGAIVTPPLASGGTGAGASLPPGGPPPLPPSVPPAGSPFMPPAGPPSVPPAASPWIAPPAPPVSPTWAGPPAPPSASPPPAGPWGASPASPSQVNRRTALIAAGVVVVLIAGYFGLAAGAKLPPFASSTPVAVVTPTPAPTATPRPTSSATAHPTASSAPTPTSSLTSLKSLLPSYITGDSSDSCAANASDLYVAASESGQELCDLTGNSNAPEDYVMYAAFPTETPATAYFGTLLSGNGMSTTQGDCSNLTYVTAADGSSQYCQGTYTTKSSSGVDFVWSGSASFDLGNNDAVSDLSACASASTVTVVGFTDPNYAGVGLAIGCSGFSGEDADINSDFTAGDFFLGT